MSRRRAWIALAVLLLAGLAALFWWRLQQREEERRAQVRALEAEMEQVLTDAYDDAAPGPPFGLSAAFVLPDGRVGVAASGVADEDADAPMTPDCRFMAGSLGKSFFAALAVELDAERTAPLDAPISRWLDGEPWWDRLPNGPDLTLRLLLQHRSGLVDHISSFEFVTKSLAKRITEGDRATLSPEELVEIALDRDPLFPAGEGFEYGDTNYVLAGLAMERATGRSAFDEVEERFLRPFDIDDVVVARERDVPGLCPGHQLPVNPFLLPYKMAEDGRLAVDPMVEYTAGGMAMAPRGAARWAHLLFGGEVLGPEGLDELVEGTVEATKGRRYGLGVFVYDTDLGTAWGHGGWFPGYRSELRYFEDSGLAVVVQASRDVLFDVGELTMRVARALHAELESDR